MLFDGIVYCIQLSSGMSCLLHDVLFCLYGCFFMLCHACVFWQPLRKNVLFLLCNDLFLLKAEERYAIRSGDDALYIYIYCQQWLCIFSFYFCGRSILFC